MDEVAKQFEPATKSRVGIDQRPACLHVQSSDSLVGQLMEERGELESILAKGADRAREVASATLADVYDKVGLV